MYLDSVVGSKKKAGYSRYGWKVDGWVSQPAYSVALIILR